MVEFVKENCQDKPTVYYYYHYFFLKLITIKKKKKKKKRKKEHQPTRPLGLMLLCLGECSQRYLLKI